ncbi:TetR/AcrR family transcriptional regulator [Actinomadura sp. NAK00032]|uniref:TetR/AcrR family transcriptional regulator n=1 Tax=Actinomadura sp. NAK00032 TaxID=2742128 RepID=UPI00159131E2|nr:TetR/AcrR family transcriptional regulator [Actinomadura sp. NAK00032]QKW33649.1 TetR/AcrR family transcriptional regulator [Actinomadura sp. NAK00032]
MVNIEEPEIPVGIALAWGLRDRPGKGPRPGLSLPQIVQAALDVARADGLAAVSMARVAKEVGVSTMALYRYVAAKDDLLDLMQDAAYAHPPEAPADKDWRAGLTEWAWAILHALRRHPWVLQMPVSGPPLMPNQIAWLERGLTCLDGTGLAESEKLSVVMLLSGYVRQWAGLSIAVGAAGPDQAARYATTLARVIDPVRFPAVSAAMAAGAVNDEWDDGDAEFVFGLDRVLDGIAALTQGAAEA